MTKKYYGKNTSNSVIKIEIISVMLKPEFKFWRLKFNFSKIKVELKFELNEIKFKSNLNITC